MPGVTPYTVKPLPAGASNYREAGIVMSANNNNKLALLTGASAGGDSTISVPPVVSAYPEIGADGQTIAGNTLATTTLSATGAANSEYDGCVGMSTSACNAYVNAGGARRHTSKRRKTPNRKLKATHHTKRGSTFGRKGMSTSACNACVNAGGVRRHTSAHRKTPTHKLRARRHTNKRRGTFGRKGGRNKPQ